MTAKAILNEHRANVVRLLEAESLLDTGGISQELLERCRAAYKKSEADAVEIIEKIDDPFLHAACTLRFLLGYEWKEIAGVMGGKTPETIRARCGKYLRSMDKK